jgi:hypothetical protein
VIEHYSEGGFIGESTFAYTPAAEQTRQEAVVAPATTMVYEEAPVVRPPLELPSRTVRPRNKFRPGRVLGVGMVIGVLLTAALLVLDTFDPYLHGALAERVHLVRESFPDMHFAIRVPSGWDVKADTLRGRPAAIMQEPESGRGEGHRGFRVVLDTRSFNALRKRVDEKVPDRATQQFRDIDVIDGLRVADRKAFRHRYVDGDEYWEEWWIERGKQTYRMEFWSPLRMREESAELWVRIARTFEVVS